MKDDWTARLASIVACTVLYLILDFCLSLGFPDRVAALLAVIAIWSLCIVIIALGERNLRLAYRQGIYVSGCCSLPPNARNGDETNAR
jgi:hypothetical protein